MLTAARAHELLSYDPDTGLLIRRTCNNRGKNIGDIAGSQNKNDGYWYVQVEGQSYAYHRLIWFHVHGVWPLGDIDHIDGDKSNNRIANLRDAPSKINMQNERKPRKNNKSGLMGVHYRKERNKWVAQLRIDGKAIRLGSFNTPEEAHVAYIEGKRKHHPGFML